MVHHARPRAWGIGQGGHATVVAADRGFGWDDGHPTHTVLYECPAAREAWGEGGSGIPTVPDGAYLVSVEVEPSGVVGWVLSDVADLFGAP